MTDPAFETFAGELSKQPLVRGDAIILLLGDGLYRVPHATALFQEGYAPRIVIVGNDNRRSYGSYTAAELIEELQQRGVPGSAVISKPIAPHTRAEGDVAMQLAKENGWNTLLLVTSPHHQYRAFLSFLKAMCDCGLDLSLVNAPAPLSMTEETPWGRRQELLVSEFDRIAQYQARGEVISFAAGLEYLARHLRHRSEN